MVLQVDGLDGAKKAPTTFDTPMTGIPPSPPSPPLPSPSSPPGVGFQQPVDRQCKNQLQRFARVLPAQEFASWWGLGRDG